MRNARNGLIRGKLDQTKVLINENMMGQMKRINNNVILDVSEIASGCTGSSIEKTPESLSCTTASLAASNLTVLQS